MKIRVKFAKRGAMKFIGHLDIMRYFQKAMRRAEIDIAYSEGFSPHQKMSFAAPLGVGLTSEGEYFDIEVHSTGSSKEMVSALNRVMTEGMEVLSWKLLTEQSKNAMSLVAAADYELTFREGYEPQNIEQFVQDFSKFIHAEQILITKKTKKGERQLDLKPLIYEASIQQTTKTPSIFLRVCTGSTDNIKPELVMKAYYESQNKEMKDYTFQIKRLEVYANVGTHFVPLDALGEEI